MKDIRKNWKALASERKITSGDIAALCIYRALVKEQGTEGALSRLRKSYSPITNPVKLANGADPNLGLKNALWEIKNSSFRLWLEPEQFAVLLSVTQDIRLEMK